MKSLLRDKFSVGVITLMAGTIVAQAIPVLISPVLTRLYTPEAFGQFSVYLSLVMFFIVPVSGRYEMAIILPEQRVDAIRLIRLCLNLSLIFTAILALLIIAFNVPLTNLLNLDNPYVLFLVPLSVFCVGIYQILNLWLNRLTDYKSLSVSRFVRSGGSSLGSILLGFTPLSGIGLALGDLIGQFSSAFYLFLKKGKGTAREVREVQPVEVRQVAERYRNFPKFNILTALYDKFAVYIPVLFLSFVYGPAIAGFFGLSQRVISVPGSIISRAVGDVFRQQANEEVTAKGECRSLYLKTGLLLFGLSIIPFALLFFAAPWLFKFVFGEEWETAGFYTQLLLIMYFLQFTVSPLTNMYLVKEKQKLHMLIGTCLSIALVLTFTICMALELSAATSILVYAVVYSLKYLADLIISWRLSGPASPAN